MTVMRPMLSVSKEVFNTVSTTKMTAVRMATEIYGPSQALYGGFFLVKL